MPPSLIYIFLLSVYFILLNRIIRFKKDIDVGILNKEELLAGEFNITANEWMANRGSILIDDFGAEDNFTHALETAISKSQIDGGIVIGIAGKTYYSRSTLDLTNPSYVNIDLSMSDIVRSDDFTTNYAENTAAPIINIVYSHGTPITASGALSIVDVDLTNNQSPGITKCTRIPLTDTSTLSQNDYIHVYSDDRIPWGEYSDNEYLGMSGRIAVVGANYIDLYGVLDIHDYLLTNVRVSKKTQGFCSVSMACRDPEGWWNNPDTAVKYKRNVPMIKVTGAIEPIFPHLKFRDICGGTGLETIACYNPIVDILDVKRLRTDGNNYCYGYGWVTGCTFPTLRNPRNGESIRHFITSRGKDHPSLTNYLSSGGTYPNDPPESYTMAVGGVVFCHPITGSGHSPWDTHSDSYRWTFYNPVVRSGYRGPSAGYAAVNLRGTDHSVIGLESDGVRAVSIRPSSTWGSGQYYIQGRHHRRKDISVGSILSHTGSTASTRNKVILDLVVTIDDGTGDLFEFNNCNVDFKGHIDWAFQGASTSRIFSLTNSSIVDRSTIDLRRATGTGPRLYRFADGSCEARYDIIVHGNTIPGSVSNFTICDFVNNGGICLGNIRLASGTMTASFSNTVATSVFIRRSFEYRETKALLMSGGNKTLSISNDLKSDIIFLSVGSSVAGAVYTTLPTPTTIGQVLCISNDHKNSSGSIDTTESIVIEHNGTTIDLGGENFTIPVNGLIRLIGDPILGKWTKY